MGWDESFARRDDEWSAKMTEDVPFYVGLAREADGPIVELGVGNGRVAIPVASATGRRVIGIDLSQSMMDQAQARAEEAGVELDLRLGDMRELALDQPAALIYCPFRALLHVPTWGDRRRTFERVAASLRPGGRFAWNAFAFDHRVAVELEGPSMRSPNLIPSVMRWGRTAPTSRWKMVRPARCGGRRRTSGSGWSTWPASKSKRCTAGSTTSRSATTAESTSS